MADSWPLIMRILIVGGARPNFVKIAPLLRAFEAAGGFESLLVDTGQHYDDALAGRFLRELELPPPRYSLRVGSGSHAAQTAAIMERFEPVLLETQPDLVVVVGDVNSTLACALVAAKLGVRLAHVEAGLRSFDRRMPEEINRLLSDALADLLFTSEAAANANLEREGIPADKILFVGSLNIDSLDWAAARMRQSTVVADLGLGAGKDWAVATLHRPANVDDRGRLESLFAVLTEMSETIPVVLPLHPRTRRRVEQFGLQTRLVAASGTRGLRLVDPLGHFDFLRLVSGARLVLTDSGGLQEETTCLGVPCLTLRDSTERPATIDSGTNVLAGTEPREIRARLDEILQRPRLERERPPLWDGRAAERVAAFLQRKR